MAKYTITIETDFPDGDEVVRQAAQKIACEIGWGDQNTTSIQAVRHDDGELDLYLCGYEMEPGDMPEEDKP